MKKKIIILIAVRLKSERLKEKALLNILNQPMILFLVERLRRSQLVSDIYLCTSTNKQDDEISTLAEKKKIKYFRGEELDVMSRFLEVSKLENADILVRVTGDNPLTDPIIMDQMIKSHITNKAEYTFTEDIPHGTRSEVIDRKAMMKCHKLIEDKNSTEYMSLMFNRPDFFKINRFQVTSEKLKRPDVSLTVDTEQDYEIVNKILKYFKKDPHDLEEVIKCYDNLPSTLKRKKTDSHLQNLDRINVSFKSDV